MQIVELKVDGWMRLSAARIRPDGSLVVLEGPNGAGKSSVLDAVFTALRGKEAAPPVPINKSAEHATIKLDIGEFIITRTFKRTADGSTFTDTLKLTTAEGTPVQKPQTILNALLGDLAFDPLDFLRRKPAEQADLLKKLIPGVDFIAIEKQRREAFERRTDVNRRQKAEEARANAIKLPPGRKPEKVDVAATAREIEDASAANAAISATHQKIVEREKDEAAGHRELDTLRNRIEAVKKEILRARADIDALAATVVDPVDITPLREKLAKAQEVDRAIALFDQREAAENAAIDLAEEAAELTARIEALDERKVNAITEADLPVPGLGLGDGEVILDGLPLQQAMTAMQIRTSVAIAGALNPRLRVIIIREGSMLDKKSMAALAQYAEERDLQIWVEKVADEKGAGIWIENGEVK